MTACSRWLLNDGFGCRAQAHAHFRTLGDFEVVSVGGLATSGASQAPHPASPAPTPNSPFPYATRGHQSPGLFSPIHGGVAAVSPAGRSFTGSPAHQDLSAVGTAISALSDALQGSVEGLEGIADPMTGAGVGADGAAVEEHRVVRSCSWAWVWSHSYWW